MPPPASSPRRRGARAPLPRLAAVAALLLAAVPATGAELTLEECFRLADAADPGVAAARAGAAAAAASARADRAGLRPRLDARASALRLDSAPEARFPSLLPGAPPVVVPLGERDVRRAELTAGWVAFAGGALRERAAIGGLEAEAAVLLAASARADLRLEVVRRFAALQLARRRREVLAGERRSVAEHRAIAAALFEEGAAARGDLLAADVALARLELESVRAEADERLAAVALGILLGTDPGEPLDLAALPEEGPPPAPARGDALAAMRAGRAELAAARLREAQARRAVRAAAGARWPRLSLAASWYLASEGTTGDPGAGGWQVAGVAEWGLLDFGQVEAGVDRAEAEALRAGFALRRLEQALTLELEAALLARETAERELAAAAAGLAQAAESRRVARELYRAAAGTAADVLDADAAHAAAATAVEAARSGRWVAAWELRRATGELAAAAF